MSEYIESHMFSSLDTITYYPLKIKSLSIIYLLLVFRECKLYVIPSVRFED